MSTKSFNRHFLWLPLFMLLSACASTQTDLASQITLAKTSTDKLWLLNKAVTISTSHAKDTLLKPQTKWQQVGSIMQGTVYKTKDQVVIVNSFNVHEAYIVVKDAAVVGYYLPVEKTFVESVSTPITLSAI